MKLTVLTLIVAAALSVSACGSPLRQVYAMRGYSLTAPDTIKHVAILAWAPKSDPQLAELLAREASDVVKLRRDFLVHEAAAMRQTWAEACRPADPDSQESLNIQGVIVVRALDVVETEGQVEMTLEMELFRCGDGALVWRGEAGAKVDPKDEDLKELTRTYVAIFEKTAERFAAPAFVILKALAETIPSPFLTDDEISQKIELES